MAIVGGLSHSALARLSKTIACLPPESQKVKQMCWNVCIDYLFCFVAKHSCLYLYVDKDFCLKMQLYLCMSFLFFIKIL